MRTRRELERLWAERVLTARLSYYLATLQLKQVLSEQEKSPPPELDRRKAIRNARQDESAAQNEYMRSVKIFSDLVLYGKLPEQRLKVLRP